MPFLLKLSFLANCTKSLFNIRYFAPFCALGLTELKLTVQFSCSVVSDSLRLHEPQHARSPCPSPSPRVHSDSRPLSPWCHPAISSSVVPFSSCPQSLPASESFPMSQHFEYWSFSFSIIPSKEIPGPISFRMDWLVLMEMDLDTNHLCQTLGRMWRFLIFQGHYL